jgi:hypothetical protein
LLPAVGVLLGVRLGSGVLVGVDVAVGSVEMGRTGVDGSTTDAGSPRFCARRSAARSLYVSCSKLTDSAVPVTPAAPPEAPPPTPPAALPAAPPAAPPTAPSEAPRTAPALGVGVNGAAVGADGERGSDVNVRLMLVLAVATSTSILASASLLVVATVLLVALSVSSAVKVRLNTSLPSTAPASSGGPPPPRSRFAFAALSCSSWDLALLSLPSLSAGIGTVSAPRDGEDSPRTAGS